jgi:two-component system OmpR family response regulator
MEPPSFKPWSNRPIPLPDGPYVKLLIVDDDNPSAQAMAAALDEEGFDVQVATGAIDAFEHIDGWAPELILLDINMPLIDGFTAAGVFRRMNRTRDVVIIALTALDETYVQQRCKPGWFDGYIQKGTPMRIIVEMINGYSHEQVGRLVYHNVH